VKYIDPSGYLSVEVILPNGQKVNATVTNGVTTMPDGSRPPNGAIVTYPDGRAFQMDEKLGRGVAVTNVQALTPENSHTYIEVPVKPTKSNNANADNYENITDLKNSVIYAINGNGDVVPIYLSQPIYGIGGDRVIKQIDPYQPVSFETADGIITYTNWISAASGNSGNNNGTTTPGGISSYDNEVLAALNGKPILVTFEMMNAFGWYGYITQSETNKKDLITLNLMLY